MMEKTVEEGNRLCLYGEVPERVLGVLLDAFAGVAPYFSYKVKGQGRVYGGNAFCEREVEGCTQAYDVRLRPAKTLLRLLGRVECDVPECSRVGDLPPVNLREPLRVQAEASPDKMLEISSATIQATFSSDPAPPTGASDAASVWGTNTFSLTLAEAAALEASARVVCDLATLPPSFYTALAAHTTKHIAYYSTRRVQPLADIGHSSSCIASALQCCHSRSRSRLDELLREPVTLPEAPSREDVAAYEVWASKVYNLEKRVETTEMEIKQQLNSAERDKDHREFLDNVRRGYKEYGFTDDAHAEAVLGMSLNELSNSVCQSMHGYFFVGGSVECGGMNQLCAKTPVPITFLSAAGIDFCTDLSTETEGAKYFSTSPSWTTSDPLSMKFTNWKEGARETLYKRVKSLYRCIFRAAEVQGVGYPCMLQMGLGVFLANVPEKCKVAVRKTYVRAQVDLLKERGWGFEAYLLNAGPPVFAELAREAIEEEGTEGLSCPIVLHSRDVKFISVALASKGLAAGYLNPSDEIAVLQGCIGYYWELGRGNRYVGEEDFAATSTAVLSHCHISDVHTDPSRVLSA